MTHTLRIGGLLAVVIVLAIVFSFHYVSAQDDDLSINHDNASVSTTDVTSVSTTDVKTDVNVDVTSDRARIQITERVLDSGNDADDDTQQTTLIEQIRHKQDDLRASLKEQREEVQLRTDERQEELRQQLEDKRAEVVKRQEEAREKLLERKADLAERAIERIRAYSTRILHRLEAALDRLERLADRMGSRIEKLEESDHDLSIAKDLLIDAYAEIADARINIIVIEGQIDDALFGENPREAFGPIRELIKEAALGVRNAHRSLVEAIREIKAGITTRSGGSGGVTGDEEDDDGEDEEEDEEESNSTLE